MCNFRAIRVAHYLILMLGIITASPVAYAGEDGLLYGTDHAFSFRAPSGWVLDNRSGLVNGLHAVFYPEGQSWANSPVMAYATVRAKLANIQSTKDVVRATIQEFRDDGSAASEAKLLKSVQTSDGRVAEIYEYSGDSYGNKEYVAYIDEKKTVNLFVLNSRTAEDFERANPRFEELVSSYKFLGDSEIFVRDMFERARRASTAQAPAYAVVATKEFFGDGSLMRKCVPPNTPKPEPVTLYFEVLADGSLGETLFLPPGRLADCIRNEIQNRIFSPPQSKFTNKVELSFRQ